MVDAEVVKFPRLPKSSWWQIRRQFVRKVPGTVTGTYLAGFLQMTPDSAGKNLIGPLRTIGLIDEDDKPTDLAFRWRDDAQYPNVCGEIRESVYPEELLDTFPDTPVNRTALTNWFANKARVGEGAAKQMATFYLLLLEADAAKQDDASASRGQGKTPNDSKKDARGTRKPKDEPSGDSDPATGTPGEQEMMRNSGFAPSLHIDVQVHISPEASPEQIDTIFASMAKHLYKTDGR